MYRTHDCGALRTAHLGQTVTLSGWVQRVRDFGAMSFIDLRDRYGITQLSFNAEKNADLLAKARELGREFVIKATGTVVARSSVNSNLPTGEIELEVTAFSILNAANNPPFTL